MLLNTLIILLLTGASNAERIEEVLHYGPPIPDELKINQTEYISRWNGTFKARVRNLVPPLRCCTRAATETQANNTEIVVKIENLLAELEPEPDRTPIVVDTYFHVVSPKKSTVVPKRKLKKQFDLLREAYVPHGIDFKLRGIDVTIKSNWGWASSEFKMKEMLRKGGYSALNVYFVDHPYEVGGWGLGFCPLPDFNVEPGSYPYLLDGCMVGAYTVPEGEFDGFNTGFTLIHEVGHWFGLSHTIQNHTCGSDSNLNGASQQPSNATAGCSLSGKSCPNPSVHDPRYNWMDYFEEKCFTRFNAEQENLMHATWRWMRQGK